MEKKTVTSGAKQLQLQQRLRWRCQRRRRRRHRQRTENEKNRLRIGFVMLSDCACKNQSHKATPLKTQKCARSYTTDLAALRTNLTHFSSRCMCMRGNGVCPLFSVSSENIFRLYEATTLCVCAVQPAV